MQFINTFQLHDFLDTLISLFVAFALGTLIGAERQYRQRSAGLRTNVVVSVGAAAFIGLAYHLTGLDGAVRVIAQVVSGIGFSGAGAIMKGGHQYSLASTPAVERAAEMRDVLNERLQAANYPIRETKFVYRLRRQCRSCREVGRSRGRAGRT